MTDIEFWDDRSCGCMLGLAIGDALGAPVEFMTRAEIVSQEGYGPGGIWDLAPHHGLPAGTYTDDTQMSVATARGILDWRAAPEWATRAGSEADLDALAQALWQRYLEWSHSPECPQGSPGGTVLASIRAGVPLTLSDPVNEQGKGCGGVMRVAPLGLIGLGPSAFEAGARAATLTHRHPTSDASAGFLAQLIDHLVADEPLSDAVTLTRETLLRWEGHDSALDAVDAAVRLAAQPIDDYEAIGQIGHVGVEEPSASGKGWVAEEALGIALFCALRHEDDFVAALLAAVNISGDSDSTGALTGAILGAACGVEALPEAWRENVANNGLLVELGQCLAAVRDDQRAFSDGMTSGPGRRPLTSRDVDRLLAYLPWLELIECAGRDGGPIDPMDGAEVMNRAPASALDRRFEFWDELYGHGWIVVFDWTTWELGRCMYDDPEGIMRADLLTLRRLCTAIVRAEKFGGGMFESALAQGVFATIVRRLAELRSVGAAP